MKLVFLLIFLMMICCCAGAVEDSLRVYCNLPDYGITGRPEQKIYYHSKSVFTGKLTIACYQYMSGKDSLKMFSKADVKIKFKKGTNTHGVTYVADQKTYINLKLQAILKKTSAFPPGVYKIFITISKRDSAIQRYTVERNIDSALSGKSTVHKKMEDALAPAQKFLRFTKSGTQSLLSAEKTLDKTQAGLDKEIGKDGISCKRYTVSDRQYCDFYYDDWFIGRYILSKNEKPEDQLQKQKNKLIQKPFSFSESDINPTVPVFTQKKENTPKKEDHQIKGEISLATNVSSGQEQYSDADNNYTELHARIETPVMNMPMEIEGFYTTQDVHRSVKSSFIKMHYDAQKSKDELTKSISAYTGKVDELKSKGMGMGQVYQSYISKLESEKAQTLKELAPENAGDRGQKPLLQHDLDSLLKKYSDSTGINKTTGKAGGEKDSLSRAYNKDKDSLQREYNKKAAQVKKVIALEQRIEKYRTLLAQSKNAAFFDSVLAYDKVKNFEKNEGLTYKQLASKAENILPDGQSKSFLTGITHFDAGIFSAYQSKFTMAGQNMKGAGMGYDFKLFQTDFAAGQTQYIGSDGNVDKYIFYTGKATFEPTTGEHVSLIYYGYTPSQKMLSGESFFKDVPLAAPSFRSPVSIFSLNYDARITKNISLSTEAATSFNGHSIASNGVSNDNSALHFDMNGKVPGTKVTLIGSCDKVGTNFQNNSLPVLQNGTEQFQIGGKTDVFRSLLTVGINYNYLLQSALSSTGTNTKWGFDVKTNSKRYPMLSVSYKPYATYRSYTDTLAIAQRPIIGSVFITKATYQVKRVGKTWRFTLLYNKNSSQTDSGSNNTSLFQLSANYTTRALMGSLAIGRMQVTSSIPLPDTSTCNATFINSSLDRTLSDALAIGGGNELGLSSYGMSKFALNAHVSYRFKTRPFMLRFSLRDNNYRQNMFAAWKSVYSGNIDVTWTFKDKLSRK